MMILSVPTTDDGVVGFIAITDADLVAVSDGSQPAMVDMRANFRNGTPLPSHIQLVFCSDHEDFLSKLREHIPDLDENIVSLDD